MGSVTPLRPIRVLVAGGDKRYLRAAAAVLAEHGYLTKATEKTSGVCVLADQWRADVVVLDASGQVGRMARTAAALEAAEVPKPVLMVADRDGERVGARSKWDVLDELAAMVSHSYFGAMPRGGTVAAR